MSESQPQRRWFCPTPAWLVYASLLLTAILFLSERWRWFAFNEHKGWTVLLAVAGVGVALLLMLAWFLAALIFRRRFQFGIRTLLVLTLAVALPCSWLGVEIRRASQEHATVQAISLLGSVVFGSDVSDMRGERRLYPEKPSGVEWLRRLLGDEFFGEVIIVRFCHDGAGDPAVAIEGLKCFPRLREIDFEGHNVTDAWLLHLQMMDQVWYLSIRDTNVTDVGLRNIKQLPQLDMLWIFGGKVSDVGLNFCKEMPNLRSLAFTDSLVTDAGLECVECLPQLEYLNLANTQITDAGLVHLKGLKQLESLCLAGTKVTDAGLANIRDLTRLSILNLRNTSISDTGLKHIENLKKLIELNLSRTKITDAGIDRLRGMVFLCCLNIERTGVTANGVSTLERTLPDCGITH